MKQPRILIDFGLNEHKPSQFDVWMPMLQPFKRMSRFTIATILILICLISTLEFVVQGLSLFRLDEAGYGDSYILYDVLQFQKTGRIYRNLAEPPFLPAQYSPLVYALYSLPGRVASWDNPFVGPRLLAIATFIACICVMTSIVRVLFRSRLVWVWGLLLPFSIGPIPVWILMLRGDFAGLALSLLAVRLLLSDLRWAVPLSAVCAGLAVQVKFTFVAAALAGAGWLLVQGRWREVVRFVGFFAVSSLGLYLLYSLREPGMMSQMLALSPGIRNVAGNVAIMKKVAGELVILLSLVGLASVEWHASARETLLALYLATTFVVAAVTAVHAGADINYYWETFFAAVPFAVLGVLRLLELVERHAALGPALAVFLFIHSLVPVAMSAEERIPTLKHGWVDAGNDEMRKLSHALAGSRVFSSFPRLALLTPNPPLMEPFLLSYLHRLGKVDLRIFTDPLLRREYDVVITYASAGSWRNVKQLDPELRSAIESSYKPYCTFHRGLFHFPDGEDPSTSILKERLTEIGCSPASDEAKKNW
ncbi:membrane protein of unknown function [Nitrospira japonica]|uniref:Glycosyltransferase RgtA/B/C/D-like domain-containing protein n=2 Tax=Nitrospira japonica TaxID=1325564 RepID=A0A1W1I525_9BACT|nr:membrane protein of unknown function [Nitrospira japonica]